jgi:hypothetical protein
VVSEDGRLPCRAGSSGLVALRLLELLELAMVGFISELHQMLRAALVVGEGIAASPLHPGIDSGVPGCAVVKDGCTWAGRVHDAAASHRWCQRLDQLAPGVSGLSGVDHHAWRHACLLLL